MSRTNPWPQYSKPMPELFFDCAAKWPDHPVFKAKLGGQWTPVTWRELEGKAVAIAAALVHLGVEPRARAASVSHNRPEWSYVDFGTMIADVINVPIYPTNTAEQVAFVLADSGSEIVFVEDQRQLEKIRTFRDKLPKLKRAVIMQPYEADDFVMSLDAFMRLGRDNLDRPAIDQRWQSIDPEQTATLIYTSGTTGNPKGVMLCHRNLVSNIEMVQDFLTMREGDSDLQHLPLCHAYGRMEAYVFMMHHGTVNFAESIEKIPENLREIRPIMFVTVPRLLEKVYEKIQSGLAAASPVKRALFNWALGVGRRHTEARSRNAAPPLSVRLQLPIADRLVFSKIRAALGGHVRILGYAAAPLAVEIQEFFAATGITAMEAYGLTETSPGLTANKPNDFRLGSVGKPARDTEVKIAPDGEVLVHGPQVMLGYWNSPQETAEALVDGWFLTGDIGSFDEDGFLWITDRKKDIIITAGGKNVAPQNIENAFKLDPAIEQVAVVGDRRKFLVALIAPESGWLASFAKANGLAGDAEALVADATVRAEIERRIAAVNTNLAKFETIKRFELLAEPFTVENGLLTPTLKVRRKNVMQRYGDLIESLYRVG